MKQQLNLFVWATAVFGISAVLAVPSANATTVVQNNIGYTAPVVSQPRPSSVRVNVNEYEVKETYKDTYDVVGPDRDVYHAPSPSKTSVYDGYNGCTAKKCAAAPVPVPVREYAPPPPPPVVQQEPVRREQPREPSTYEHLANPFFQPKQGHFGSMTDLGWGRNSYDFSINNLNPTIDTTFPGAFYEGIAGSWKADQLFIKQDVSFGVTDTVAIIGSVRYEWDKYYMNWDNPVIPNDKNTDSGFNQWGIGLQWKFADNQDWIGYIAGFYQWNQIANAFLADAKVGYKIANSTVYGLARLWSLGWKDNSYGNGVVSDTGQVTYFAFKRDVTRSLYFEAGAGVYSELSDEWSVNAELIIGDYEWHTQAGINAAVFYQATQNFAIGVYGRMSIWDSANSNENVTAWGWDPANGIPLTYIGTVDLQSYSDIGFGVKMLLYF